MCGGHPLSDEQGSRGTIDTYYDFRKRIHLNAEIAIPLLERYDPHFVEKQRLCESKQLNDTMKLEDLGLSLMLYGG